VLVDHELSGVVVGQTLATRPEQGYRALLEATAFGTRVIVETFVASGVPVTELIAAGGLLTNRQLMQTYADVLRLPISTIASERTRAVKMSLDRDRVTLSVTSPENGTASEEIPADYGADGIEIGFNARYLLDILGQIEGDTMEIHLADAAAPTLLRENDKAPALYVLMPMRV